MPLQSDADKVAEKVREDAWSDLVAEYQLNMAEDPNWNGLNVRGHEVPDPNPQEPPIGYIPGPDLIEQIRAMVRGELSRQAELEGEESFEEADDFDIDDDIDPTSPYEEYFDPQPGSPAGPALRGGGGAEPPSALQGEPEGRTSEPPLAAPPAKPSKPSSPQPSE